MADDFITKFKENAARNYFEQSFEVDLSEYNEEWTERWTIKPLNGKLQDKVIPIAVRDHKMYEAIANMVFYRACKPGTTSRRFKNPQVIEDLMSDPDFLDWFAKKIRFHEDMKAFVSGEEEQEAVKNSSGTTGSAESS